MITECTVPSYSDVLPFLALNLVTHILLIHASGNRDIVSAYCVLRTNHDVDAEAPTFPDSVSSYLCATQYHCQVS